MSASDDLAAIAARLADDENEYAPGVVDQTIRDRRYLLTLVREQSARLEKVEALASDFAQRGQRIEEQFDGTGSAHAVRAAGLGDGYREAARSIRAALSPALVLLVEHSTPSVPSPLPGHQSRAGSGGLPPHAVAG